MTIADALRGPPSIHRLVMPSRAGCASSSTSQSRGRISILTLRLASLGAACNGDARADLARFASVRFGSAAGVMTKSDSEGSRNSLRQLARARGVTPELSS